MTRSTDCYNSFLESKPKDTSIIRLGLRPAPVCVLCCDLFAALCSAVAAVQSPEASSVGLCRLKRQSDSTAAGSG